MTSTLSRDDLWQMLKAVKPSSAAAPNYIDRREYWLKAAATCARLLLYPPEDEGVQLSIGGDYCPAKYKTLTELSACKKVADYRVRLAKQGISVLGIHFLDKLVGRWSRIWVGEWWPLADDANASDNETFEFLKNGHGPAAETQGSRFIYGWLFSHLWMRAYWLELRTTATLINAFHDGILSWNQALHFRWDVANGTVAQRNIAGHGAVTFDSKDVEQYFANITTRFAGTIHRCIQGGSAFSELLRIRKCYFGGDKSARSNYLKHLRLLTNQIHEELSGQAILERFRDNACRVRQLAGKGERDEWLCEAIRVISGSNHAGECKAFYDSYREGRFSGKYKSGWGKNLTWIEAIYSALMNGSSFTGNYGFTLNRIASFEKDLYAYVVVGFRNRSGENAGPIGQILREVYDYLEIVVELVHDQCNDKKGAATNGSPTTVTPKKVHASRVSHDIVGIADRLRGYYNQWAEPHAVQRWLQVIKSLADQSVHEGLETEYLCGIGPAYLSRVRGRLYEPAPGHFLNDSSKGYRQHVTHYLKSYFSLFGQKGKICWFDPEGRFRGVFEFEEPSELASDYLRGEIVGHRKFDVIGQGRLVLGYRDGTYSFPQENVNEFTSKVKGVVEWLLARGQIESVGWYKLGLIALITELVRRLEERDVSCGIVVMVDSTNGKYEQAWLPFDSQYKRLATRLERFEGPIVLHDDIAKLAPSADERTLERVVDGLVPLAKLDGAVLLRIKPEGICCEAACQVIPIVNWSVSKGNEWRPLDIFNVPPEAHSEKLPRHYWCERSSKPLTLRQLKQLADVLCGSQAHNDDKHAPEWLDALSFLNSAGTRHHSLWGITVSAEEPLFTVTISSDGHLRLFCGGMVVVGPNKGSPKSSGRGRKGT